MYDNEKIAEIYAYNNWKANARWEVHRNMYLNDLAVIKAIFYPTANALDEEGEFTDAANDALNLLEDAVHTANAGLDSYFEVEDYELAFITLLDDRNNEYYVVVGMTDDEGVNLIEDALIECSKFGVTDIILK